MNQSILIFTRPKLLSNKQLLQGPKGETRSTPWAIKKGATFIFTITMANVDRFQ